MDGFFGHQLLAVAFQLKRFLFGNTHQPFVPLDDAVFPCNQIQAGQHQGVIGQDLKRLQCNGTLFAHKTARKGLVIPAGHVPAQVPVIFHGRLRKQLLGLFHGHGFIKIVPLGVKAVHGLEHEHLLLRLHALGDDGQVQPPGHLDDRFHDLPALAAFTVPHDELHIQLDGIHAGIAEHIQGGIAAAKIIHQHGKALAVEGRDGVFHHFQVLGQHTLGDLHQQQFGLQLIFLHQLPEHLRHIQRRDIRNGDIDRDGHHVLVPGFPAVEHLANLFPQVEIQPGDEARLFHQGHKLPGRHDAPGWVVPAHQRFHPHNGVGHAVALGL